MINLEDKTLAELKELAKENNIKNISKLKKEELVQVLEQVINSETISTTEITKKNETNIKEDENNNQEGYKLTNEGDEIVEGILDILQEVKTIYQVQKMFIFQ